MDNINFNNLLSYALSAFTKTYGEEYQSAIEKVNDAIIIYYENIEGMKDYFSYIESCKSREFSIRFLDQIGVDVEKYKKDNYTKKLEKDVEEMLNYYIGNVNFGFLKRTDNLAPIQVFSSTNDYNEEVVKVKIKTINFLLGNKHPQITKETYVDFTHSKEYTEVMKKINQYKKIYEQLLLEYKDWETRLLPYKKYIEYETKRKELIFQKKKKELFEAILSKIPLFISGKGILQSLKISQQTMLGNFDISSATILEYFHPEQIEKLKNPNVPLWEKYVTISCQLQYLINLGIMKQEENMVKCESLEDITRYLNFLKQDFIKKYIPPVEFLNEVSTIRKEKYEEAMREYYTTRKDYIEQIKKYSNNKEVFENICNAIKEKQICILGEAITNEKNKFIPIMLYTIRTNDGGALFYNFMHEIGHLIDKNENGCGFETTETLATINPYDNRFRKYEKFNETVNDICVTEAVKILENQGIYLIEPSKYTSLDLSNHNTALLTKNLLMPLIQKFRSQVIKAKVNAKPEELIKYIGEDNFENLVDVINKVDYLTRNGLIPKLKETLDDPMVLEYLEQVEKAKQIYSSIDEFYANHFETTMQAR